MSTITIYVLFFFHDTPTTEIYTLSLHDALPILNNSAAVKMFRRDLRAHRTPPPLDPGRLLLCPGPPEVNDQGQEEEAFDERSEEHTSELQSQSNLVCRLLLEKKKKRKIIYSINI